MRGVINSFGGSRSLLITVTVQLTSTRLIVGNSVDNMHGSLERYILNCTTEYRMLAVR